MAKLKGDDDRSETIAILQLDQHEIELRILFRTPLLMNRLPKKAREQLLLPAPRQNKVAREQVLKHDPPFEFRDSVYRCSDPLAPTAVHIPGGAFKKAMAQAALDIPGATKAEIGRLVEVIDPTVHLYGIPHLHMSIVRQAGINRTPDIRTRAIFPRAACKISVGYIRQRINETDLLRLLAAAGIITGVGDGRPEKGALNFGKFTVVGDDDPAAAAEWKAIVAKQGRAAQEAALLDPHPFDAESEELLAYFHTEVTRREHTRGRKVTIKEPKVADVVAAKANGKRGKQQAVDQ